MKIQKCEDNDSTISVSLETFRHCEVLGAYKVLSYCWGAPYGIDQEDHEDYSWETAMAGPNSSILCNGRSLIATKNLREALLQLREDGEEDRLWIDAICINQSDENEKAIQIEMMANLYAEASMVMVWLGIWDEESETAIKCISSKLAKRAALQKQEEYQDMEVRQIIADNDNRVVACDEEELEYLQHLFRRRWFRRVWVVQEIALAKDEVALCGPLRFNMTGILRFATRMNGDVLVLPEFGYTDTASQYHQKVEARVEQLGIRFSAELADWIYAFWNVEADGWSVLGQYRHPKAYLKMSREQQFVNWMEILLERLSHREATHKVDIIFAALSLLLRIFPTEHDPSKVPGILGLDYTKPPVENYCIITAQLLALAGNLNILSLVNNDADIFLEKRDGNSTPSWAPNMNKPLSSSRLLAQGFDASSSSSIGTDAFEMFESFRRILSGDPTSPLKVKGVVLGSITALSPPSSAADTESWAQTISSITASRWSELYPDLKRLDVLARTLCATYAGKQFPITDTAERTACCTTYLFQLLAETYIRLDMAHEMSWTQSYLEERFEAMKSHTMAFLKDTVPSMNKTTRSAFCFVL